MNNNRKLPLMCPDVWNSFSFRAIASNYSPKTLRYVLLSICSNSAPQKLNAPIKSTTSGFGALTSGFFQKNQVAKSFSSTSLSAATLEEVSASSSGTAPTVEEYVKAKGGDRPIRKILIANNGMAATKAIMSMRQWAYMT